MFLGKLWFLPALWFLGKPFLVPGKTLKSSRAGILSTEGERVDEGKEDEIWARAIAMKGSETGRI